MDEPKLPKMRRFLPAFTAVGLVSAAWIATARGQAPQPDRTAVRFAPPQVAGDEGQAAYPSAYPAVDFGSLTETAAADADTFKQDQGANEVKEVELITRPTYKVIGRVFADHLMLDQSPLHASVFNDPDSQTRTRFDSVRIGAEGDVFETVDYKAEIAFMEGLADADRPVAKDVYLTVKELVYVGHVRVGHFKEPFSLDQLTSSKYITFMERSLLDTFAPARNMGIMAFNHLRSDETLSWYAGGFRSEIDDDAVEENESNGDYSLTKRLAWNPFYDEPSEGRYFTHVGAAYSYRQFGDNNVSFRKDPELNIRDLNVILLTQDADAVHLFGTEWAWVNGPFSLQSEWVLTELQGNPGNPDGSFGAFYVQTSYFLTGEHRGYRKSAHAFDRVQVLEPFFAVRTAHGVCTGKGAWELKARYSYIDLNDLGIAGGRVEDWSTGLNWYLNPYTRVMFDYIHSISEAAPGTGVVGGSANLFGMRAQVDW